MNTNRNLIGDQIVANIAQFSSGKLYN